MQQIVLNQDFLKDQYDNYDVLICDPPYSSTVHSKAVSCTGSKGVLSNARKRDLGFDHLSPMLREHICLHVAKARRWSVLFSDIESTHLLREGCVRAGAQYIRTLAWIRWSMPQLSGDRPPSGREDLLFFLGEETCEDAILFHGTGKGRKRWNGPGNLTHLAHKCLRGDQKHRAEKPLDLMLDLVDWFSEPGETVFDPCAGSGTTGLACRILGRNFVGLEVDPIWADKANKRLKVPLSERDQERRRRWLEGRKK